jgi:hypothetical protein
MKQSAISFLLTPDEFKLLASIVYLEPALDEVLSKVKAEEGRLRIKFLYEDLEDSLSALAHEVEHESAIGRRHQICVLIGKLEGYKRLRKHVQAQGKAGIKKKAPP